MLMNNEPFSYAHLIKFERPSRPGSNGLTSTSKERYTYLTDASRDVEFNDGSRTLGGIFNGTQSYLANKVLKVSPVSEQTEAKASNFSITLDGNGLGAIVTSSITVTSPQAGLFDVALPVNVDLVYEGFREGDKVTFTGGTFSGDYNIHSFRENNVLRLSKVDTDLTLGAGVATIALSSEEIKSILLDKSSSTYSSFINREVFIYRAYFKDGFTVGAPTLIFKGIISNVAFDDGDSNITVTWGLTSHWGDFAQVRGRITSDDFHRALDEKGIPQPQSALKLAYAYDKGFTHSETSINILATYTVQVEKQKIKTKKGFFGIGAKVKVKKYLETEGRNTELDFQLQAKSIPLIYGVRNTKGTIVFADTLNNNSSVVYVIYVLSEGEIGGIYDVYVNGVSLMCNDKSDFDARSVQTKDNTVGLVCRGRADRGDVLGGATSTAGVPINFYAGKEKLLTETNHNYTLVSEYKPYVAPVTTSTDLLGKGIIDGESIQLSAPQNITLDVFSGKVGQKASSHLVEIAAASNFKIQKSYWMGSDTAEYWGPNHRLLDTAYVVGKFIIAEGETTIPDLEFVTRGKVIDCYNYDQSYSHYTKEPAENPNNFKLGDMVRLYQSGTNATLTTGLVQIIDKWTFTNPDGTTNTRFRWSTPPNLGGATTGIPTIKLFYMQNAAIQNWHMVTFNYEQYTGIVGGLAEAKPTSSSNVGGFVAINYTVPAAPAPVPAAPPPSPEPGTPPAPTPPTPPPPAPPTSPIIPIPGETKTRFAFETRVSEN